MLIKFKEIFPKLLDYKLIIWDFDGVIKDSVAAKSKAYIELFKDTNTEIKDKIEDHHKRYGGLSRFKKIPLYLSFNGILVTDENISIYAKMFSKIVINKVLRSPWVLGMPNIFDLLAKQGSVNNVILSATPQSELEYIVEQLDIKKYFIEIIGTSDQKSKHICRLLKIKSILPNECVFIGDSYSDYQESLITDVDFIYRISNFSSSEMFDKSLYHIEDFKYE